MSPFSDSSQATMEKQKEPSSPDIRESPKGKKQDENANMNRDMVVNETHKLPYFEMNFIGTYVASILSCAGCFVTYIMPVTSLGILNSLIGPSPNVTWIALAWTLLSAVSFTLLGRLSDLFGRRWFFAGSSIAALIGSIIGATANDINTLIAASVFLGLASAGQLSNNYVIGELVPVNHRFAANALIFLATLPTSALGPYLARLFIAQTSVGWRGIYYLGIAIHGAASLCWILFYHPPRFQSLHRYRTMMQEVREMDFTGIFLFIAGSVLFLLGLSWGGQLYPWASTYTLTTLCIGFAVLVVFILYETYMPLKRPLIPMHLFKNYGYTTLNVLSAVGGVVYYSMAVLFPTMVVTLFETDIIRSGLVSCAVGGGVCAGQFIGAWIAVPGGHLKLKLIFSAAGTMGFVAAMAGATDNEQMATALAICSGLMVGLLESIVSTAVTVVIDDQSEIGLAAGVSGSIRAAASVLATAIYVSILQNKVNDYIQTLVAPSLAEAGLPLTSIEPLLLALGSGQTSGLTAIPGVTPAILQVAATTLRQSYAMSFKIVYLATIAAGGLSFITSLFIPDIDDKLTSSIVRRLDVRNENKRDIESTDPDEGSQDSMKSPVITTTVTKA